MDRVEMDPLPTPEKRFVREVAIGLPKAGAWVLVKAEGAMCYYFAFPQHLVVEVLAIDAATVILRLEGAGIVVVSLAAADAETRFIWSTGLYHDADAFARYVRRCPQVTSPAKALALAKGLAGLRLPMARIEAMQRSYLLVDLIDHPPATVSPQAASSAFSPDGSSGEGSGEMTEVARTPSPTISPPTPTPPASVMPNVPAQVTAKSVLEIFETKWTGTVTSPKPLLPSKVELTTRPKPTPPQTARTVYAIPIISRGNISVTGQIEKTRGANA